MNDDTNIPKTIPGLNNSPEESEKKSSKKKSKKSKLFVSIWEEHILTSFFIKNT